MVISSRGDAVLQSEYKSVPDVRREKYLGGAIRNAFVMAVPGAMLMVSRENLYGAEI